MGDKIKNDGIWVIGDVHGEYDMLMNLIKKLPNDAIICFTGDLIDRGKKSAEVIQYVIENNHYCVLGNHEYMMMASYVNNKENCPWKNNYGVEAIISYKKYDNDFLRSHLYFISQLPYFLYFEVNGHKPLVVSHSYIHHLWVGENHKYTHKSGGDILWKYIDSIAHFSTSKELENGIYNVFGHTPHKERFVGKRYAAIDTGATYKSQYGVLSALHYPSMKCIDIK